MTAVVAQLLEGQLGQRHQLVPGTFSRSLFGEEEIPLLHEAFQVVLSCVAGFQLPHFRQKLIFDAGLAPARPHGESNGGLLAVGSEGKGGQCHAENENARHSDYPPTSREERILGALIPLLFLQRDLVMDVELGNFFLARGGVPRRWAVLPISS